MFFLVSKIAEFFINPAHIALLLAATGVAMLFTRFAKAGRTLATAGTLALLAMSFSPLAIYLALPLENRFARPAADMPRARSKSSCSAAPSTSRSAWRGAASPSTIPPSD